MTRTDFERLCEDFFELESDLDLLNRQVDGVHFWERVRFFVHKRLAADAGVADVDTDDGHSTGEYRSGAKLLLKNLVRKNPYLADEADLLFYGKGRRKQLEDGLWWDIYIDPIVDELDDDCCCLERPFDVSHRTPTKTDGLRYTDLILYTGTALQALGVSRVSPDDDEKAMLERIEDEMESRFGTSVPLTRMVCDDLARRKVRLPLYRRLVRRVDPEVAFLTSAYNGRETFVEACQAEGVPVVELQHGVITKYHVGYSFPDEPKHVFPDYFFSFGEFWSDAVELPILDERVYPVGFPYFGERSRKFAEVEPSEQVVFISQPRMGQRLASLAVEFQTETASDVVYKLHPKEYDGWQAEYPDLAASDVTVVTDDPPLYEIFAGSAAQVGLNSTALYEGLNFGLETYVLDAPGAEYMGYLLDHGYAESISSAEDLCSKRSCDAPREGSPDTTYFFEANALDRFRDAVGEITSGG